MDLGQSLRVSSQDCLISQSGIALTLARSLRRPGI